MSDDLQAVEKWLTTRFAPVLNGPAKTQDCIITRGEVQAVLGRLRAAGVRGIAFREDRIGCDPQQCSTLIKMGIARERELRGPDAASELQEQAAAICRRCSLPCERSGNGDGDTYNELPTPAEGQ